MNHFFDLKYTEIYKNIFVYHDLIPDNKLLHAILSDEGNITGEILFSKWSDWYGFGKLCSINSQKLFYAKEYCEKLCDNIENKNNLLTEFYLFNRLNQATNIAINNYIKDNNVPIPENCFVTGANPAKYNENFHNNKFGYSMNFHTDYNIGEWWWPGEKFFLTCTTYVNDDYVGGEIVFYVDGDIIEYKPKAGEIIVFPSGDPMFPGNIPYYHGVKVVSSGTKYLVRNYVKYKTENNLDVWTENENKYGKEEWYKIAMEEAKHKTTILYEDIFHEDGTPREKANYSDLVKKIYNI